MFSLTCKTPSNLLAYITLQTPLAWKPLENWLCKISNISCFLSDPKIFNFSLSHSVLIRLLFPVMDRTKELECKKFQRRCIKTWKTWAVWIVFINLNPINGTFLDLKALDYFSRLADDQATKQFPWKHSFEGCTVFGISTHGLFKAP